MTFILRNYQDQAVISGLDFLNNPKKDRGVIVIPTGGGKSLVIANIVKYLNEETIIFQPSKELLEQNFEKYISYGEYATIFSASKGQKKISETTFATIGSVINKLEYFRNFKYCIVDECHLVSPEDGSMYKRFFEQVNCKTIGFTATPVRLKKYNFPEPHSKLIMLNRSKPRFFKEYIHVTQIKELADNGFFAKTEYIAFDFDKSQLRLNSTGADFTKASIDIAFAQQNIYEQIFKCYLAALRRGKKHVLIFVPKVENAAKMAEYGSDFAFISGMTPKAERERVINDFKQGIIKAVVNVGVLTTGFDFPALDCVILARPTISLALYYQMIGRGVRPFQTKESCIVVDLCGNFDRFGRVEDLVIEDRGGWGIYAGNKLLTGVEMDLLLMDHADNGDEPVWPFGKYRGKPISSAPKGYLKWVMEEVKRTDKNQFIFDFIEQNELIEAS